LCFCGLYHRVVAWGGGGGLPIFSEEQECICVFMHKSSTLYSGDCDLGIGYFRIFDNCIA